MTTQFAAMLEGLSAEEKQEITTIPQRFVERALDADWDGVADLYHPDAVQRPPDQPPVKGRDAIRDTMSRTFGPDGGAKLDDFSVEIREAEALGDVIYVRAAYRLTMSPVADGVASGISQQGPYINLLRKDDAGHWRIYRQIYGREHPPQGLAGASHG